MSNLNTRVPNARDTPLTEDNGQIPRPFVCNCCPCSLQVAQASRSSSLSSSASQKSLLKAPKNHHSEPTLIQRQCKKCAFKTVSDSKQATCSSPPPQEEAQQSSLRNSKNRISTASQPNQHNFESCLNEKEINKIQESRRQSKVSDASKRASAASPQYQEETPPSSSRNSKNCTPISSQPNRPKSAPCLTEMEINNTKELCKGASAASPQFQEESPQSSSRNSKNRSSISNQHNSEASLNQMEINRIQESRRQSKVSSSYKRVSAASPQYQEEAPQSSSRNSKNRSSISSQRNDFKEESPYAQKIVSPKSPTKASKCSPYRKPSIDSTKILYRSSDIEKSMIISQPNAGKNKGFERNHKLSLTISRSSCICSIVKHMCNRNQAMQESVKRNPLAPDKVSSSIDNSRKSANKCRRSLPLRKPSVQKKPTAKKSQMCLAKTEDIPKTFSTQGNCAESSWFDCTIPLRIVLPANNFIGNLCCLAACAAGININPPNQTNCKQINTCSPPKIDSPLGIYILPQTGICTQNTENSTSTEEVTNSKRTNSISNKRLNAKKKKKKEQTKYLCETSTQTCLRDDRCDSSPPVSWPVQKLFEQKVYNVGDKFFVENIKNGKKEFDACLKEESHTSSGVKVYVCPIGIPSTDNSSLPNPNVKANYEYDGIIGRETSNYPSEILQEAAYIKSQYSAPQECRYRSIPQQDSTNSPLTKQQNEVSGSCEDTNKFLLCFPNVEQQHQPIFPQRQASEISSNVVTGQIVSYHSNDQNSPKSDVFSERNIGEMDHEQKSSAKDAFICPPWLPVGDMRYVNYKESLIDDSPIKKNESDIIEMSSQVKQTKKTESTNPSCKNFNDCAEQEDKSQTAIRHSNTTRASGTKGLPSKLASNYTDTYAENASANVVQQEVRSSEANRYSSRVLANNTLEQDDKSYASVRHSTISKSPSYPTKYQDPALTEVVQQEASSYAPDRFSCKTRVSVLKETSPKCPSNSTNYQAPSSPKIVQQEAGSDAPDRLSCKKKTSILKDTSSKCPCNYTETQAINNIQPFNDEQQEVRFSDASQFGYKNSEDKTTNSVLNQDPPLENLAFSSQESISTLQSGIMSSASMEGKLDQRNCHLRQDNKFKKFEEVVTEICTQKSLVYTDNENSKSNVQLCDSLEGDQHLDCSGCSSSTNRSQSSQQFQYYPYCTSQQSEDQDHGCCFMQDNDIMDNQSVVWVPVRFENSCVQSGKEIIRRRVCSQIRQQNRYLQDIGNNRSFTIMEPCGQSAKEIIRQRVCSQMRRQNRYLQDIGNNMPYTILVPTPPCYPCCGANSTIIDNNYHVEHRSSAGFLTNSHANSSSYIYGPRQIASNYGNHELYTANMSSSDCHQPHTVNDQGQARCPNSTSYMNLTGSNNKHIPQQPQLPTSPQSSRSHDFSPFY